MKLYLPEMYLSTEDAKFDAQRVAYITIDFEHSNTTFQIPSEFRAIAGLTGMEVMQNGELTLYFNAAEPALLAFKLLRQQREAKVVPPLSKESVHPYFHELLCE